MLLLVLLLPTVGGALRSFHYTLDFPNVPYAFGLRHIHTPEHIASTHRLGMPFYKVTDSTPPTTLRDFTFVQFKAGPCHSVCMFTRTPNSSHMLFERDGQLTASVCMGVQALGKGHTLTVDTLVFGCRWWTSLVVPLSWTLHAAEDKLWWSYSTRQDANLIAYRRKVLFREKNHTSTSHLCSPGAHPDQ